tara:strand:- start:407 stop:604 length:198 start_codon:yes stop_codon:yes gene_type:complete
MPSKNGSNITSSMKREAHPAYSVTNSFAPMNGEAQEKSVQPIVKVTNRIVKTSTGSGAGPITKNL